MPPTPKLLTFVRAAGLACLLAGLSGCYAHRGGAVAQIDPASVAVDSMDRVTSYDLRVESNTGGDAELKAMAERALGLALRSSGTKLYTRGAVAEPDAELSISVDATGSILAQALNGFVFGASFGLIPGYARFEIVTEAETTRDGAAPAHYRYADTYALWIHILLLPFNNTPERVLEDLLTDMMRSLARDLQRDGFLPPPTAKSPPPHPDEPADSGASSGT